MIGAGEVLSPGVGERVIAVELVGEGDLALVDELRAALSGALDAGGAVIVDLSRATFVDSSILGALIWAHKRAIAEDRLLSCSWAPLRPWSGSSNSPVSTCCSTGHTLARKRLPASSRLVELSDECRQVVVGVSVQGDPSFMRRVNGWLTLFWIVMIPTSFVRLAEQRHLRVGTFALGACFRALVDVAGCPGRGDPAGADREGRRASRRGAGCRENRRENHCRVDRAKVEGRRWESGGHARPRFPESAAGYGRSHGGGAETERA